MTGKSLYAIFKEDGFKISGNMDDVKNYVYRKDIDKNVEIIDDKEKIKEVNQLTYISNNIIEVILAFSKISSMNNFINNMYPVIYFDKIKKIIKENGREIKVDVNGSEENIYEFGYENMSKINREINNSFYSYKTIELFERFNLINLVSMYESFLYDIINFIMDRKPGIFENSDKKLNYSDISKFDNIDQLKKYMKNKEIDSILREDLYSQIQFFAKITGKDVKIFDDLSKKIVEIFERRNIFIHTNGFVNDQYINVPIGDIKSLAFRRREGISAVA